MKILADQNIPCVEEAFQGLGEVEILTAALGELLELLVKTNEHREGPRLVFVDPDPNIDTNGAGRERQPERDGHREEAQLVRVEATLQPWPRRVVIAASQQHLPDSSVDEWVRQVDEWVRQEVPVLPGTVAQLHVAEQERQQPRRALILITDWE